MSVHSAARFGARGWGWWHATIAPTAHATFGWELRGALEARFYPTVFGSQKVTGSATGTRWAKLLCHSTDGSASEMFGIRSNTVPITI